MHVDQRVPASPPQVDADSATADLADPLAQAEATIQDLRRQLAEYQRREAELQQRTQSTTRKRRAQLARVLEELPLGLVIIEGEPGATRPRSFYANRLAAQQLGLGEPGARTVAPTFAILAPGGTMLGEDGLAHFHTFRTGEQINGQQVFVRYPPGDEHAFRQSSVVLRDMPDSREVLAILEDITAHERAEQNRAFLATIVESSDDAIIGEDFDGTIISWNDGAEKIYGYTAAEALGRNISMIFPPEIQDELPGMLAQVRKGQVLTDYKSQRITKAGQRIHTTTSAFPIFNADNRVLQAGSICRDITQFAMLEELRLAKEAAEIANRAKSEYLSRMSHELRTPLNAILGFAQLLQMNEHEEEDSECIELIMHGSRHLLNLINDVLDIARIESGKVGLSAEPVSVEEVLVESLDLITPMALHKGIAVGIDSSDLDGEVLVMADRQRLKQIMLNYLSNAVKYNPPDVPVTISYQRRAADRLRLLVSDGGAGIAPEKLPLLFSPFERLGAERGPVEGTGLGLAIARQLAEAMDGSVGVESVIGAGTTFWVELPVAAMPPQPTLDQAHPTPATLPPTPDHPTFTILYIEDNPISLRLIERILGHRPRVKLITAHSGLGYELAEQHQADLILLDLNLPDLSGEEALQRLLANPATSAIPVVILSADASAATVRRLKQAGAHDFLTKPIEVPRFLAMLDDFLEAHE